LPAPAPAVAGNASETVRDIESSLGALRADFEQLSETLGRLMSSHLHAAKTLDGLRTSVGDMEREVQTTAASRAAFEADTVKALLRNKDAVSALADQISKLESPRVTAEPNQPTQAHQQPRAGGAPKTPSRAGEPPSSQRRSAAPPPRPTSPPPRPTSSAPALADGGNAPAEPPTPT